MVRLLLCAVSVHELDDVIPLVGNLDELCRGIELGRQATLCQFRAPDIRR